MNALINRRRIWSGTHCYTTTAMCSAACQRYTSHCPRLQCTATRGEGGWSGVALGDTCQSQHLMNCNVVHGKSSLNMWHCTKMQNTTKWYKARRALCTWNALHRPEPSACKNHVETSQTDGGGRQCWSTASQKSTSVHLHDWI